MNKKMSELFHEFVHDDELNGNDEIIRETNAVVAEDDIEVRTMLDDGVGKKYFYRCMELAENVIKSFEDEQSQLDDSQKIVLEWLKKQYHERISWPFPFSILKNAINDMPENVFAFYDDLNEKEEFELLIGFAEWGLEQEEENNDH
ncbi:hypothetical protein [Enterococcus thailandicus]|uniref:hypothetical protein n=1 Tax=Enterococcus thailandicus TaxID=417368 RepID=UPI003B5A6DFC